MNLLVIRLSAMGDVALTLPVLRSVLERYPDVHLTLVTREQFLPFFENTGRLKVVVADVKGKHKGIPGLFRLFQELKKNGEINAVIDLHHVLRSQVLSFFFRTAGTSVFKIDKGRTEKKRLTRKKNKIFKQLKHTTQRYAEVFERAGFPVKTSVHKNYFNKAGIPEQFLQENNLLPKNTKWIGIAPFSKHREKMWPLPKMEQVIQYFSDKNVKIFLFGGGENEINRLNSFQKYPTVFIVAGLLPLHRELALIRQLDVMISMDSANMHIAALSGIPVVSIWGATHPYAGFGPLNDNEQYIIQIPYEKLDCRPCSVFGNKPCWRGDHACMEWIMPEEVIKMAENMLNNHRQ
ncbi:MAG: glycosyltransferase family 9 protein [Chitinophagaceae bacterium]|nr:MAG: glycosyltransferase family 9 protein [Chitinophagaceae bacterium]